MKVNTKIHDEQNIRILNKDESQPWQGSYCSCGWGKHILGGGSYQKKMYIGFICISI